MRNNLPTRRRWLVGASVCVHIGVVFGLFVAGFWQLDKLEPGHRSFELKVPSMPAPAPEGGSVAVKMEPTKPKRVVVKTRHQPEPADHAVDVASETPGTGSGSDKGSGSRDGPPNSTGDCLQPECGGDDRSTNVPDPPKCDDAPIIVQPSVIKGMRIAGETQILPSDVDKAAIQRGAKAQITATFKVCVGPTGSVASLSKVRGSGFDDWDRLIATALHAWRYKPYQLTPAQQLPPKDPRCARPTGGDTRAVTVCGMVTFVYAQQ